VRRDPPQHLALAQRLAHQAEIVVGLSQIDAERVQIIAPMKWSQRGIIEPGVGNLGRPPAPTSHRFSPLIFDRRESAALRRL
jgi:hypothetical protein